jgi:SagB-type dehydrogenase family enzyme
MKDKPLTYSRILREPISDHATFHQKTALHAVKRKGPLPKHHVYFKAYDRLNAYRFGRKKIDSKVVKLFERRSSIRSKTKTGKLTVDALGSLLYYSAGIRKETKEKQGLRYYPSAGALYPLELYVIPHRVNGLIKRAIYHYNVKRDYFEERVSNDPSALDACFQQGFVSRSDALIVLTGIHKRTIMKYGERGYRYEHIEAGHVGQNIYLLAAELGLRVCGICGFFDNRINAYLHLNGIDESTLYVFSVNA